MLESYSEKWPDLILELLNEIYVDDISTGAETICSLVEKKLIEICMSAGIPLSKWRSNVLVNNAEDDTKIIFDHESDAAKILGVVRDSK